MAINRSYTFSDGTTVGLRGVPPLMVEEVLNSETGKPRVPRVPVQRAGVDRMEDNPDDPAYTAALNAFEQAKQKRVLRFVALRAVADDPPPEFTEEALPFLPDGAGTKDIKYMWIASMLQDEDEVKSFVAAALGQTMTTPEGIAESEAAFPGDGERAGD